MTGQATRANERILPSVGQSVREYFDAIYVINLPDRSDRREEMHRQLARIGLSFQTSNVFLFPACRPTDKGEFETTGARGCFLSHLRILENAAQRSLSRILVLEDDLNFVDDFSSRVHPLLRHLASSGWSIFYGGHRASVLCNARADTDTLMVVAPEIPIETTHFVGFQAPAIGSIATMLRLFLSRRAGDPEGGPMHVDGAYNWYRRLNPTNVTLAAVPELGYQRSSRSDVHAPAWADRAPLVRDAVAGLRRLKNRVRHG